MYKLLVLVSIMFASSLKKQIYHNSNLLKSAFQPPHFQSVRLSHSHSRSIFDHQSIKYDSDFYPGEDAADFLDHNHNKKKKKKMPDIYIPKSDNQKKYLQALQNYNNKLVICHGPAGTGKTLFACNAAIQELKKGSVQKIILTRPIFSVDEELGYLPGNILCKMDPWTRPIFDILSEFYSKQDIDTMIKGGVIEISPLAFMRGRTFKKAFIIADEMQNSSPNQMLMLATRIGQDSRMAITGDLLQSDRCANNGLHDLINRVKLYKPPGLELIELDKNDVFRSEIVTHILELYNMSLMASSEDLIPSEKTLTPNNSQLVLDVEISSTHNICNPNVSLTYDFPKFTPEEIEIQHLERNSELEVAGDYDVSSNTPLSSPTHSDISKIEIGIDISQVDSSTTHTSTHIHEDDFEKERAHDDIIIVYKEDDSALIPKHHITRNIIRFFDYRNTTK